MTQTPLVDVVIPTRNRASMTAEAVESVRRQTFTNWRVIVVDDASSDDSSASLANTFGGDPRIGVVVRSEQGGPQAARHTGFEHGTAPYVAFLDSDDLWLPGKLERQLEVARGPRAADVVLTWHEWIRSDGQSRGVRHPFVDWRDGPLISTNMSTLLLDRRSLERVGGPLPPDGARYSTCEGIEFYLRLSGACSFAVVDDVLVHCREHGGARTSNEFASAVAAQELAAAMETHRALLDSMPRQRAHLSGQAAARFFAAGDFRSGGRWLLRAMRPDDPGGAARAMRTYGPSVLKAVARRLRAVRGGRWSGDAPTRRP